MTAGLVCFPDTRSGRNPIDHVRRCMLNLEKLEMQAPGRARRRGGNAWGALRALSLSVALPIGELSTDLLSLRSIFMNLLAFSNPMHRSRSLMEMAGPARLCLRSVVD